MRALVIHPDNTYEVTEIESGYQAIKAIVGGWIEAVPAVADSIYINEEGKLLGLPYNELATELWRSLYPPATDWIAGSAVVLGPVDANGDDTEVSEATVARFMGLVGS